MEKIIKKLKVIPYHKLEEEEEIFYKKTIIKLYEDKLDYKIDFKYKTDIIKDEDDEKLTKKVDLIIDEEGIINKENITSITRFIDNNTSWEETAYLPVVEILHNGCTLSISCQTIEERNMLYKELKDWRYNQGLYGKQIIVEDKQVD